MFSFVGRALGLLSACSIALSGAASAQTWSIPGPRIEIPSLTPQAAAAISARTAATHFIRRDGGPRYVIYGSHSKALPFPADLTPARGRSYIDAFAQVAPALGCRTDDLAHAYEILLEASLLVYNGTHFAMFAPGPLLTCAKRSFGAVSLDENVHINMGGMPAFTKLPDRSKQALYEIFVVTSAYLIDNLARAKPGSPQAAKARADAADVVKSLTGFNAGRVHLTDSGLSIDDQARP